METSSIKYAELIRFAWQVTDLIVTRGHLLEVGRRYSEKL
jgi:hypothetical protein